jgi:hypothetical protein
VKSHDSGKLLAHAWIEVDGTIITGGDDISGYDVIIGDGGGP